MIFRYDELKECVEEDFERFYKLGFNEKQILPAVLNEYEHGEGFCIAESACIHIFLALIYNEKEWNCHSLIEKLKQILNEESENTVQAELGDEYIKFVMDLNMFVKDVTDNDI